MPYRRDAQRRRLSRYTYLAREGSLTRSPNPGVLLRWHGEGVKRFIKVDGQEIEVRDFYLDDEGNPIGPDVGTQDSTSPVRFLRADDQEPDLPLPEHVTHISLMGPATSALVERAAAILAERPGLGLQVITPEPDLDFLADLPALTYLRVIDSLDLANVDAIATHATTLRWLELHTGLPRLDIAALGELKRVEQLYLRKANRTLNGVESALAGMPQLRYLTLHSVTLNDRMALLNPTGLQGLAFKLGGNRDLSFLPDLRPLRFLEIWGTRMLEDLSPLAACDQIKALYLSDLPRVTLPDMSQAKSLEDAAIFNLPKLGGLAGIAAAPRLRYLAVTASGLTAADVEGLREHPSLEAVYLPLPRQPVRPWEGEHPILGLPTPPADRLVARVAGVMNLPIDSGEAFAS